jgi:hypothetical protein
MPLDVNWRSREFLQPGIRLDRCRQSRRDQTVADLTSALIGMFGNSSVVGVAAAFGDRAQAGPFDSQPESHAPDS